MGDETNLHRRPRRPWGSDRRSGDWQTWPHASAATSTTIVGLDTDTLYGVQARAVNANGPGEWSLEGIYRTGEPDHICDILNQLAERQ